MAYKLIYKLAILVIIPTMVFGLFSLRRDETDLKPILPHGKMKGITVVAPPEEIDSSAFIRLRNLGTDWVALVPYGFTRKGQPNVRYNSDRQWWGERKEGIEACVSMAKAQGLKVMLKPQVWMGGGWIGELDFVLESDWIQWEKAYHDYIMEYMDVALRNDVEMFCIGTEINVSVEKRPAFWYQLIKEIKSSYKGQLTYSANWDHFEKVPFWLELDYIGISSYFPLSAEKTPSHKELCRAWSKVVKNLNNFSTQQKRPILFTEYGYLTVDGCAGKTWELENKLDKLAINHIAQANSYDALWTSLHNEKTWAGGFLWKWFPAGQGHEGYLDKDYTPQDKPAEAVIGKWFMEK